MKNFLLALLLISTYSFSQDTNDRVVTGIGYSTYSIAIAKRKAFIDAITKCQSDVKRVEKWKIDDLLTDEIPGCHYCREIIFRATSKFACT